MANDLFELVVLGNVAGQPVENVLHFEGDSDSMDDPIGATQALHDAWEADVQSAYLACLPDNYTNTGRRARRVNNGGGNTVVVTANDPGTRTGSSDLAVAGPCMIFPAPMGGGIYSTGKLFLPGVSSADVANGQFDPALKAAIQALIDILIAAIVSGGANFVYQVISRATGLGVAPVVGSISLKPGIQNRRLRPTL